MGSAAERRSSSGSRGGSGSSSSSSGGSSSRSCSRSRDRDRDRAPRSPEVRAGERDRRPRGGRSCSRSRSPRRRIDSRSPPRRDYGTRGRDRDGGRARSRSRSRSRSPPRRRPPPPPPGQPSVQRSRSPARGGVPLGRFVRSRSPPARRPRSPQVPDEYLLDAPEPGSVVRGRVVSTKPFGAFVSMPGYRSQGLVHISQLAATRVEAVEEVAHVGDEVWVHILSVEGQGRAARVSCSMKSVDQQTGEQLEAPAVGGGGRPGGKCYNCGEDGHLSRDCPKPRQERPPHGAPDVYPDLFSIHKGAVAKIESFGAFITMPGFRKNGLLHISQVSNQRIDADDLPHILEVGQQVYVKVTMVDSAAGRYSLSMNLCSQSDGRDLDPTHVESEADRRGGKGGGDEPRRDLSAALQVPEYGGKQLGTGDYALLPDEEGISPGGMPPGGPPQAPDGKYNLVVPGTGRAPPPPPEAGRGADERAQLQMELTARLLARGAAKQRRREEKREKKEKKREKKRGKKEAKKEKRSSKKSHKHKKAKRER